MASFFNKQEYHRFNIIPRYWDKSKDDNEQRVRNAKQELGITDNEDVYVPNIKGRMRSNLRNKMNDNRGLKPASTTRMIIIFIALFMFAYGYLFDWDYLLLMDKFLNLKK